LGDLSRMLNAEKNILNANAVAFSIRARGSRFSFMVLFSDDIPKEPGPLERLTTPEIRNSY
jgi:hypothetical protein